MSPLLLELGAALDLLNDYTRDMVNHTKTIVERRLEIMLDTRAAVIERVGLDKWRHTEQHAIAKQRGEVYQHPLSDAARALQWCGTLLGRYRRLARRKIAKVQPQPQPMLATQAVPARFSFLSERQPMGSILTLSRDSQFARGFYNATMANKPRLPPRPLSAPPQAKRDYLTTLVAWYDQQHPDVYEAVEREAERISKPTSP